MRVLTIIDSLAVGGAERSLSMITPHLVTRGVEMHVAYLKDTAGLATELREAGATLHSLEHHWGRLGALVPAVRLVRELSPDLVHTTLFEADIIGRTAARLGGAPVVSSFVTESYGPEHYANPEYQRWKVRAAQIADAATARLVKRFHAVSAASASVMARRLRISPGKIDVIARGRDRHRLGERSEERRRRARAEFGDGPLVLAAARHFHLKGLDVLVEAFADVVRQVPGARLVIAGRQGPATPELRRIIERHGIRDHVILAGYRDDVPELMCAADVFVLPSRAEGSPGVLIEAMAMEVPTVATDIPSVREVAGDDPPTAALCPPESVQAMAEAIAMLLTDADLAARLAASGRHRFVAHYAMDATADATLDFYRRCLNGA